MNNEQDRLSQPTQLGHYLPFCVNIYGNTVDFDEYFKVRSGGGKIHTLSPHPLLLLSPLQVLDSAVQGPAWGRKPSQAEPK